MDSSLLLITLSLYTSSDSSEQGTSRSIVRNIVVQKSGLGIPILRIVHRIPYPNVSLWILLIFRYSLYSSDIFRSKALPFIQRGPYRHVRGFRKGECMHLVDLTAGKNLVFQCDSQPSLPESLKKNRTFVTVRIIEVDEEMKNSLLFDKCKNDKDRKEVFDFISFYNAREKSPEAEFQHGLQSRLLTIFNPLPCLRPHGQNRINLGAQKDVCHF